MYFETSVMESAIDMINDYYSLDGDIFTLSISDRKLIEKNCNQCCKLVYNEFDLTNESFTQYIKKYGIPKFNKIDKIDGNCYVLLSGISKAAYESGIGLDFERRVANKMTESKDLSNFKFSTEDYPGIFVDLR